VKLDAARNLVKTMGSGAASGTTTCSGDGSTALHVIVYRDDTNDTIAGVKVAFASDAAMEFPPAKDKRKKPAVRKKNAFDHPEKTGSSGIATLSHHIGTFSITVSARADHEAIFKKVIVAGTKVTLHQSTVVSVPVHLLARPTIVLKWRYNDSGIEGATVKLIGAAEHSFTTATDGSGRTAWDGDALEPGDYTGAFTIADTAAYELFDESSNLVAARVVTLPAGASTTKLKVRALRPIRLKVAAGATPIKDAALKFRWPDPDESRDTRTADAEGDVLALIASVPAVAGPGTKLPIESVTIPDSEGAEVFELVEVTSS
jgi:hypothetical protein